MADEIKLPSPSTAPDPIASPFTCPHCGGHGFGTLTTLAGSVLRVCNGRNEYGRRCTFSWQPKYDARYGLGPITQAEQDAVRVPVALTVEQLSAAFGELSRCASEVAKGFALLEAKPEEAELALVEMREAIVELIKNTTLIADDVVTARQRAERAPCTL